MVTPKKQHFAFGAASQQHSPFNGSLGDPIQLDPSLAIIFKGLQKRDSTTKAKASEDLLDYLKSNDNFEGDIAQDALIKSWMNLYPSLACDVDKKVRANAHTVLGQLVVRFKKKTARDLSLIAASWLLGLHDNDRAVSRAAQESFTASFPNENKRIEFKKVFRASIYEKVHDLVLEETASSLSDSRFVNVDESDAKYSNVISAALQVLAEMASTDEEPSEISQDILGRSEFWKLVEGSDASVQRSGLALLNVSLRGIDWKSYEESLKKSLPVLLTKIHSSNVLDMVRTLDSIAANDPDLLFLSRIDSKKSIPKRLIKFMTNAVGPGLPVEYWRVMCEQLQRATTCAIHTDDVLLPLLEGFQTSTEKAPKSQVEGAAAAFGELCVCYIGADSVAAKLKFEQIFSQDIRQLGPLQSYAAALSKLAPSQASLVSTILERINKQAQQLTTSNDKNDSIVLHGWLHLSEKLLAVQQTTVETLTALRQVITEAFGHISSESIAFHFICSSLTILPVSELCQDAQFCESLDYFLINLPAEAFIQSRQTCNLFAALFGPKSTLGQQDRVLDAVLTLPFAHQSIGVDLLSDLLSMDFELGPAVLERWIIEDLTSDLFIDEKRWKIYSTHVSEWAYGSKTGSLLMRIVENVVNLSSDRSRDLLVLITELAKREETFRFLDKIQSEELIKSIWSLFRKAELRDVSEALLACCTDKNLLTSVHSSIIQQIMLADSDSLPIEILCELSRPISSGTTFGASFADELKVLHKTVMPQQIPRQFAILHPIGILANYTSDSSLLSASRESHDFDNEGYSSFLRLCMFLAHTLHHTDENLCFYQLLASELVAAKLQHPEANYIFSDDVPTAVDFASLQSFVDENSRLEDQLAAYIIREDESTINAFLEPYRTTETTSVQAFYQALAFYRVLSKSRENGLSVDVADIIYTRTLDDLYLSVACSASLSELLLSTKKATFQRNKLASDLSGKIAEASVSQSLVRLNALLPIEATETQILPRQRLIFLIKNLLAYAELHMSDRYLTFELVALLSRLLPEVKNEFGTFWDSIIKWLNSVLEGTSEDALDVPLQYVTMKSFSWLAANFESNDDLSEFWLNSQTRSQRAIASTFICTAKHNSDDQAVNLCTLIASRLMRSVSTGLLEPKHKLELIPCISCGVEQVQLSAYSALQHIADSAREEMTMASALAKEFEEVAAELPAELLSIVLDCPIRDELEIYDVSELMPTAQRGYCMAWTLLFRYFQNTPLRMRVKLISDLQSIDLTESLLGFIFSVLRLRDDKPADISKISKASLDTTFTDGKGELLAYATHLYHLCLLHIPALVRTWWIDCKDRTLCASVEQLTERHYSVLLTQNDVQSLQSEQSRSLLKDDHLSVRVSNAGRDIFTTYEIDEQKMEMVIRVPANYPLRRVTVEGLQRIGVKDNQWRAWLLASQAVLTAQNGSILDAISIFQRNVSLHFEGVADCNICFSVLSVQDKSLPSKKCQTCKNLFHSSCLFKWFKSSSQSRCPLCRTSFAF